MKKFDPVDFVSDSGEWNAVGYFNRLLDLNRLAIRMRFGFCLVSGLQGLEDMLHLAQNCDNFLAVSDASDGYMSIDQSAQNRRVKTIFLAMRHEESNMKARIQCMDIMRELFRQMMAVLARDRRRLASVNVYIDRRVQFSEIEQYFFSGCACAYFQIAVDNFRPVCICKDDWTELP